MSVVVSDLVFLQEGREGLLGYYLKFRVRLGLTTRANPMVEHNSGTIIAGREFVDKAFHRDPLVSFSSYSVTVSTDGDDSPVISILSGGHALHALRTQVGAKDCLLLNMEIVHDIKPVIIGLGFRGQRNRPIREYIRSLRHQLPPFSCRALV